MRMLSGSPRRLLRSRLLQVSFLLLLLWTFLETLYIHRTIASSSSKPAPKVNTEKIFIASLPWNNEIVLRTHLINQIRDIVHALGIGNVYISVYENGSFDNTKAALRDLHGELERLGVRNRIVLDEESHQDIVDRAPVHPKEGWIRVNEAGHEKVSIHKGDYALRRMPYLAGLRNKALEPLAELAEKGEKFDKILFLNDVVYSADDVMKLLHTRDGQYAAACTLDFELPPGVYDTFALRDSQGYPPMMLTWPFFRSAASRKAVIANEPVPVQSCWNGLVAMSTTPFYHPTAPLRFRGIPDSLAAKHLEGSECCLIHYDNSLSASLGVWINPDVRVGYCHPSLHQGKLQFREWSQLKALCQVAYDAVHPGSGSWVGFAGIARGLWENRVRKWGSGGFGERVQEWKVGGRIREWERGEEGLAGSTRREVGERCLVDEMHVIEPRGWLHI